MLTVQESSTPVIIRALTALSGVQVKADYMGAAY